MSTALAPMQKLNISMIYGKIMLIRVAHGRNTMFYTKEEANGGNRSIQSSYFYNYAYFTMPSRALQGWTEPCILPHSRRGTAELS